MCDVSSHIHLSPEQLRRFTGDMRQLAGVRCYELTDGPERGVRVMELYNDALSIPVLLDRGMSIGDLTYRSMPLAYKAPTGAVHPSLAQSGGTDWLRTFPGGFMTTCGLTQVGEPCADGNEVLSLHGPASTIPASNTSYACEWDNDQHYRVSATGTIRESSLFGHNVTLTRTISTYLGSSCLQIDDEVKNQGFTDAPFMLLLHFNMGYPLVTPQSRLVLPPHRTEPFDEEAARHLASCSTFEEPRDGCREQVFAHECEPDDQGMVTVKLANPDFDDGRGVRVTWRYRHSDFPHLLQWKMMAAGTYACGIEPANCHVRGRVKEREAGRVQVLRPGEKRRLSMAVSLDSEL